ncbi:MAG TPA: ribosome maturation factor RimM [Actinomycetota bacterium]|nr:ribosome maturation factor RimM [Actinomycetota bacterium]
MVGQIGKPHGIAGEVYLIQISDDPRRYEVGARLEHANGRTLTIVSARPHRDRFLVRFEGITTRDEAEAIRGALYVSAAEARSLEDDEFWPHELVGAKVYLVDGSEVGEVREVIPGPAQDLLAVDSEGTTHLVPMVKAIVVDVDRDARRITIDPPVGLLNGPSA